MQLRILVNLDDININLSKTAAATGWHLASTVDALITQGLSRRDADAFAAFAFADRAHSRDVRPEDHLTDEQYSRLSLDETMIEELDWLVIPSPAERKGS